MKLQGTLLLWLRLLLAISFGNEMKKVPCCCLSCYFPFPLPPPLPSFFLPKGTLLLLQICGSPHSEFRILSFSIPPKGTLLLLLPSLSSQRNEGSSIGCGKYPAAAFPAFLLFSFRILKRHPAAAPDLRLSPFRIPN
jgi:hypothetical protein